jgi:hypothetical protein
LTDATGIRRSVLIGLLAFSALGTSLFLGTACLKDSDIAAMTPAEKQSYVDATNAAIDQGKAVAVTTMTATGTAVWYPFVDAGLRLLSLLVAWRVMPASVQAAPAPAVLENSFTRTSPPQPEQAKG